MGYDAIKEFRKRRKLYIKIGISLFLGILFLVIFFVSQGSMEIPFLKTYEIIAAKILHQELERTNLTAIVWDIRLPRVLCSVLVGAGLSVSGCIFQSLLRNPLADPYTLGVSTGAAFGACLAILFGMFFGFVFSQTAFAFLFAFLTLVTVIFIANKGGGVQQTSLVIAGIIISSVLSSGISFMKMLAGENVGAIVFWLMGSFSAAKWTDITIVLPVVFVCSVIAFWNSSKLNLMILGDMTAESLGVEVRKTRILYFILGSCITASCVAVSGIIGFVGLVVPHMIRFWLTADNKVILPLSGLLGGILLLLADNATRLLFVSEVPVGVLTTLLGGPFFLFIFLHKQKGYRE